MSDENIENFCAITGSSKSIAFTFLNLFQDNLQAAIENFFEKSENNEIENIEEEEEEEMKKETPSPQIQPDISIFDYINQKNFSEHSSEEEEDGFQEITPKEIKKKEIQEEVNKYLALTSKLEPSNTKFSALEAVSFKNEKNEKLPECVFRKTILLGDEIFVVCITEEDQGEIKIFNLNMKTKKWDNLEIPEFYSNELMDEPMLLSHLVPYQKDLFVFVGESNSTLIFTFSQNRFVRVNFSGESPPGVPICALTHRNSAFLLLFDGDSSYENELSNNISLAEVSFN
jgi:hypothetical protein